MAITASQVKELREKTGVGMMECKKALTENSGDFEKAILWLRERGMSRAAKKAGRIAAEGIVKVYVNDNRDAGVALEINCETDFAGKNPEFQEFASSVVRTALEKNILRLEDLEKTTLPDGTQVSAKLTQLISTIGENINLRRMKVIKAEKGIIGGYTHLGGKIGSLVLIEGVKGDEYIELSQDLAMHAAASAPRFLDKTQVPLKEVEAEKELARKKLQEEGKPEDLIDKILGGQINKFYKEICFIDQPFVKDPKFSIEKLISQKTTSGKLADYCRFQLGEGIEKKSDDFAAEVAAAAGTNK